MGYRKDGTWEPSKAEMKAALDEAVNDFLLKGGQIKRGPTVSRSYGEQRFRSALRAYKEAHPSPEQTLNPQEEAKQMRERAKERDKVLQAYEKKYMLVRPEDRPGFQEFSEEFYGEESPPWL